MSNLDVHIVGAKRTPIGAFMGSFKFVSPQSLATVAASSAVEQAGIEPISVESVTLGCVLPAGLGMAPARQVAIGAGFGINTPATTVNKVCASGMESVIIVANAIYSGSVKVGVAGGMENMSMAPHILPASRAGYRFGHRQVIDHMQYDGLQDAYNGQSMGELAQQVADIEGITRNELDDFATRSLKLARIATKNGKFKQEIAPVTVEVKNLSTLIEQDELPNKRSIEKIPTLRPAFSKEGSITPASSSAIADGAAALVLASGKEVREKNLQSLAKIVGYANYACDSKDFTKAPIPAIAKLISAHKADYINAPPILYEINEAFASVPIMAIKQLGLDSAMVNVQGGACALGHPIGCSGARIIVTLIYAMHQMGIPYGIASVCVGGGEGVAVSLAID